SRAPSPKSTARVWSPLPCARTATSTVSPTATLDTSALNATPSGKRAGASKTSPHAARARVSRPIHRRLTGPPSGIRPRSFPVHHRGTALRRREHQQLEHVDVWRRVHHVEHRVRHVVTGQRPEPAVDVGRTLPIALEPHDREFGLDEPGVDA